MKIHQIEGYIQCIYLIEYPHGLLLLDGCCKCDVPIVENFIVKNLNRPITDLKTVVVTHMHPDHAGGAHKFRQISGCTIASAKKNKHWYHGVNGILMHWIDVVLAMYVGRRLKRGIRNVFYSRKLTPDVKLAEGDHLPHFDEWAVLETPGHTDRCLSIYHQARSTVYVADLIIKLRSKFISPFPIFHPNKYRNSLLRIKQLSPQVIMLAHSGQLSMNDQDYDEMIKNAPNVPKTPLRAAISKFKQIVSRH